MKIGITGHQNLGSKENISWLFDALKSAIMQNNIDYGLTSLAIGSDQLFAEVLNNIHIHFIAIIPCDGYEQTFTNSNELEKYRRLLQSAIEIVNLPFNQPSEAAFYEAGKQIARSSDLLIAIWNGQRAKGLGGTGDIVRYAQSINRSVLHINPITKTVNKL